MSDSEFHDLVEALMRPATHERVDGDAVHTVAVLGAGSLGQLLACACLAAGMRVRLFSAFDDELAALRAAEGITVRGATLTGTYPVTAGSPRDPAIELASHVDVAVRDADMVLIATPAAAHEIYAGLLAGRLRDGQTVLLVPGRFLGSVAFAHVLRRQLAPAEVTIAELSGAPYLVSGTPGRIRVHGAAERIGAAALPGTATESVVDGLRPALPCLYAESSVLDVAFGGFSALLHAIPVLLAASEVERAHADARTLLLRDLLTPGIAGSVLHRVDTERRRVAFRYGVRELPSAADQLARTFGGTGGDLAEVVRDNEVFDELAVSVGNRGGPHVADEVPYSLVPLASAGRAAEVPTPATDSLVALASSLAGVDFARQGRTLASIGLDGPRPEELRRLLEARRAGDAGTVWQVI